MVNTDPTANIDARVIEVEVKLDRESSRRVAGLTNLQVKARVESAEPVYIGSLKWRNSQTREKTSMMVMGFDPEKPAFNLPEVTSQLDKVKLPYTILFDRASRGKYEEVTTESDRNTVTIAGLFEVGASFADDGALITSDYNFLRLFPKKKQGTVSLGIIVLILTLLMCSVSGAIATRKLQSADPADIF